MIEIQRVEKSYGLERVLDAVTLTLPKHGVTSLIGPNGAGKSTLLSIVARLVGLDSGRVTVEGLDVARTPTAELARRLSILPQDNRLATRLTVRDLVGFGRFPHSRGRLTAEDRQRVERCLEFLDLDQLADRFLDELSGGQRQRAFVAMTLCQDADYMLFDEPLNNLDVSHAVAMMKLLRQAAEEFRKTVVVVLHDINFASCYSDHIVALRGGRVILQGPPEEILVPEHLSEIYGCPFQVHLLGGRRIVTYYD